MNQQYLTWLENVTDAEVKQELESIRNDEKAIEAIKLVHPDFDEYDFIWYNAKV